MSGAPKLVRNKLKSLVF